MDDREVSRLVGRDAETAVEAATIAVKAARSIPRPAPPDPRQAPFYDALVAAERTATRRLLPRRNRWPELRAIDVRLVELDQQQAQATADLAGLRQDLQQAERDYPAELAAWIADGRKGARPASPAAEIGEKIAQLEAEVAAFTTLSERAAEERAAFARKHRKRLVAEAETVREQVTDRYLERIHGLAQDRAELRACASTVIWARLFPHDSLVSEPPLAQLVGGQLAAVRAAVPGINLAPTIEQLTALLEADAELVAGAVTREQAAALQGIDSRTLAASGASWAGTEEGKERERLEKKEALEAYRREWGHYPE